MTEQNRQDALKVAQKILDEIAEFHTSTYKPDTLPKEIVAKALRDLDRQCRELEQSLHEARNFVDAADDECLERDERIASLTEQFEASEYARELHSCGATTERLRAALERYAKPENWKCRRCSKHDPLNCYCSQWQGPLASDGLDEEDFRGDRAQPWSIARDALSAAPGEPKRKPWGEYMKAQGKEEYELQGLVVEPHPDTKRLDEPAHKVQNLRYYP